MPNCQYQSKVFFRLGVVLSLLLVACGKEPEIKEDSSPKQIKHIAGKGSTENALIEAAKKLELSCDESNCLDSQVFLYALDEKSNEFFHCTGSIMNSNQVMTSIKCLPETLRRRGVDCSRHIVAKSFYLPDPNGVHICDQVEYLSDTDAYEELATWGADYVVLKFKGNPFAETEVNKDYSRVGALYNDMPVDLYSFEVDQEKNLINAKREKCQITYKNYAQPLGTSRNHPNLSISGCQLGEKELGGLVASNEKIYGHFSGPLEADLISYFRQKPGYAISGLFKGVGFIANYACNPLLYNQQSEIPVDCEIALEKNKIYKFRKEMLNINQHVDIDLIKDNIRQRFLDDHRYLKWRVDFPLDGNSIDVAAAPSCFKDIAQWIEEFKNTNFWGYRKEVEVQWQWPRYSIKPEFDENFRVKPKSFQSKVLDDLDITFSPKDLSSTGVSDVIIRPKTGDDRLLSNIAECR
ncbi:MAG: hypothetical protein H6621_11270 [Halobacteriovoraceae bacterium]|nr:hypothetical protein [Halobacteriovoraceae bacterium]MCB9095639.1 hypothetical protein [Halobacteriovoraceae bacterium]